MAPDFEGRVVNFESGVRVHEHWLRRLHTWLHAWPHVHAWSHVPGCIRRPLALTLLLQVLQVHGVRGLQVTALGHG